MFTFKRSNARMTRDIFNWLGYTLAQDVL